MKKTILLLFVSLGLYSITTAQEIGVRLGDVSGGSVAIDGVFKMGPTGRLHADVSFGNGGVGIDALFDFINKPLGAEAFTWYAGVGPYAILGNNVFDLGATAEIGIGYKFNAVPISISADWRPYLEIIDNTNFKPSGFGLNIRYCLSK